MPLSGKLQHWQCHRIWPLKWLILHIPLALVHFWPIYDLSVSLGLTPNHLFHESVEDLPDVGRPAAVKAECILLQVPLQMFLFDAPLMCRHEPAFEE